MYVCMYLCIYIYIYIYHISSEVASISSGPIEAVAPIKQLRLKTIAEEASRDQVICACV